MLESRFEITDSTPIQFIIKGRWNKKSPSYLSLEYGTLKQLVQQKFLDNITPDKGKYIINLGDIRFNHGAFSVFLMDFYKITMFLSSGGLRTLENTIMKLKYLSSDRGLLITQDVANLNELMPVLYPDGIEDTRKGVIEETLTIFETLDKILITLDPEWGLNENGQHVINELINARENALNLISKSLEIKKNILDKIHSESVNRLNKLKSQEG